MTVAVPKDEWSEIMSDNNTAMKAGLGYTIGNVLVKGINFLTLPLFSRLLTTEEFGVCNVFLLAWRYIQV